MIFRPQDFIEGEGFYKFSGEVCAVTHYSLDKEIIKEFWGSYCFGASSLCVTACEELVFTVGGVEPAPLENCEYSIRVTTEGVAIAAESREGLAHGYMTLLDSIKAEDVDGGISLTVKCGTTRDVPQIKTRMVHFCVFPETELWELEHFLRFAAALKYTHVVIEFWGTLKYECMRELSWPNAYTKDEVRPILQRARDLGLEIVPMFNHWGHASGSRARHGKHVVLDQNPMLQTYFSEDGWCWDIKKPKVRELLRRIRAELVELVGEGTYFHIGCDEAYNFDFNYENADFICNYINGISDEMNASGRRVIAWGDMFLYKHPHYNKSNRYECNAPSAEMEKYMLKRLGREVIIADWQYNTKEAPIETVAVLDEAGFDCMLCPWDSSGEHVRAMSATVKERGLMGMIHTTWHTLSNGMPVVALAAIEGYAPDFESYAGLSVRIAAAALWRKVMPVHGDYERAGWSKIQTHYIW